MKQNLQPPATPLEMLSLFFPAGLLDYFDLVNHVSQETCFIFFLEEKFRNRHPLIHNAAPFSWGAEVAIIVD